MSGSEAAGTARATETTETTETRGTAGTPETTEATGTTTSDVLLALLGDHLRSVPADVDWATASLPDLGLDSMSAIELVVAIEDTYGAQFPEDRLVRETFATYASLESVVWSMVGRP